MSAYSIRHPIAFRGLWLVGLLLSLGVQAAPPDGYPFHSYSDAVKLAKEQQKPLFLYFGRYGCSSCLKTHKETFTDQGLKKKLVDHYVLAYVDTESDKRLRLPSGERITEMQFATRSRIYGTPTYFFISPGGEPLFKFVGFKTVAEMLVYDDYVSQGHYKLISFKEYQASNG
ncbi:MAG: thioredoxin fold domain-containing protein [Gammaproteobacteria bacterium]|nr:thioredoxin fold domain-containing protein [Gammaproteobacteria bacterium]